MLRSTQECSRATIFDQRIFHLSLTVHGGAEVKSIGARGEICKVKKIKETVNVTP